jgi:hypothetical protein
MDQIRQEVLPGVVGETIDEDYLLEQCPMLESLFTEALRLTVSSSLARVIMEPTVVGGKLLKPGNKIMVRPFTCPVYLGLTCHSSRSASFIRTLTSGATHLVSYSPVDSSTTRSYPRASHTGLGEVGTHFALDDSL